MAARKPTTKSRAQRGKMAFALGATARSPNTAKIAAAYKAGTITKRIMQRRYVKAGTKMMAARRGKVLSASELNRKTTHRVRAMRRTSRGSRAFG